MSGDQLPPGAAGVYRPVHGRLVVRMPFNPSNSSANWNWLREHLGNRVRPKYENKSFHIAREHLRHLVTGLAERYGEVHVFMDYLENQQCDTRCRDAHGDDCVCQCAGENHGGTDYQRDWIQVGETTLIALNPRTRRRHVIVRA